MFHQCRWTVRREILVIKQEAVKQETVAKDMEPAPDALDVVQTPRVQFYTGQSWWDHCAGAINMPARVPRLKRRP